MPQRDRPRAIVVIGVGNGSRGDDAVGLEVARQLRQVGIDGVCIVERYGETTDLLETWKDAEAVILIDAVQAGGAPGTISRLDLRVDPLSHGMLSCSTHAFGVAEAIALGRALRQLPAQCILYGIEGRCFALGAELSADVARAVPEVVRRVQHDIEAWWPVV
jgi:hydrogenase maturation protease